MKRETDRPLITFALLLILGGIQILSFGFIALQIVSLRREILRIQKENLELRKEISSSGNVSGMGCHGSVESHHDRS